MIKRWIFYLLALGLWQSSALAADGMAHETASDAAAAQRQVLVMLHLPPPHFRPDAHYASRYADDGGRSTRRRIAAELARRHGLTLIADWPMPALGVDCYVMQESGNGSASRSAAILSQDPRVAWAQAMQMFHGLEHPDPLYPVQPGAQYWHLADIHKVATGRGVRVAIVDSGVEGAHPDLAGQIALTENFVDGNAYLAETHGTEVAGIIAAHAGNGIGIEGVAPQARLMALRACWQEPAGVTLCNSFTLGKALNFAIANAAQVINLSLAGPPDRLLQRLLDVALARGIKLVAALDPDRADGGFPASYPGVLAVAEEGAPGIAGADVLSAPGQDIPTTAPGARWHFVSGPSYAAAHISGMMALLTQLRPALTPSQLRAEIVVHPGGARTTASLDACATIFRITGSCPCSCAAATSSKAIHYP